MVSNGRTSKTIQNRLISKYIKYFIFISYCSNKRDIISNSVENCFPLVFTALEYLYDDCNISLNISVVTDYIEMDVSLYYHLNIIDKQ
jgi:hypothetical protein